MQKEITMEEYKQAFDAIKNSSVIEIFKAMGPVLFFVLKSKDNKEFNLTIDGMWNYVEGNSTFSSGFIVDSETTMDLYKRIENFITSKLVNKAQIITNFEFNLDASKVKILFDNGGCLNVATNEFGLMTLSEINSKKTVFAKPVTENKMVFLQEN
jgi:hypothetical protein